MIRAALALALLAAPAAAQQMHCAPRQIVLDTLAAQYGEARAAVMLSDRGALVEIIASTSGTWSLLVATPEGVTCLAASGHAFEAIPLPIPGVPG